ncbi:hypothetical protein BN903_95 [Halorubrum sp. AJ67]|nr:hypothetical protein BN903_95 [Halorubrum sp. AJ67]
MTVLPVWPSDWRYSRVWMTEPPFGQRRIPPTGISSFSVLPVNLLFGHREGEISRFCCSTN